ncbi:MAG TPA: VWA domain-containing protein [Bryobacteraceae bacterium]|nr:VWA domain-containing protein [Bryobacteraceae bacterium]
MLAACSSLPAGRLFAQQDTTFSANVKVVNVLATVRGKQGQIVANLTKDDFELAEDGRPQTIRYFSRETDLPLTLGLLVDTSMSQRRVLGQERTASYRFFEQVLREGKDQAFVLHFDREVELLQDVTSSRKKLEAALELLELPQQPRPPGGGRGYPGGGHGAGGGGRHGGGTTLYDAVLLASDELMKKQAGRKALIVLSDGVDTGSKVPMTQAIEAAQRSDSLVYAVLFADEGAYPHGFGGYGGYGGLGRHGGRMPPSRLPPSRPDGKKVLERISRETGAGFFEVSKKHPLDHIFGQIQEELRSQYNLGYTPDRAESGGAYRKISLTTRQKGLIVRAREGYYPG